MQADRTLNVEILDLKSASPHAWFIAGFQRQLCVVAVLFATGRPGEVAGAGQTIVAGERYRIICHGGDEATGRAALEAAEAVWPIVVEWYSIDPRDEASGPHALLDIHLYGAIATYEAVDRLYNRGRFRANLAFSHAGDRTAHVAVQPPCDSRVLARAGLPLLTRVQVAHEAAHLATYVLVGHARQHPEWLAEGFATWAADRALERAGRHVPGERCALTSTRQERVRRLAQAGRLPSIREILGGRCNELETYDRYAVYARLFEFLAARAGGKELKAMLSDVRPLRPGARRPRGSARFAARVSKAVLERLGGEAGLVRLEREYAKFARAGRPEWFEAARSLDVSESEWVQVAFPDASAVAWRTMPAGEGDYSLAGTLEMLDNGCADARMSVLLARQPGEGHLAVQIIAGRGVSVARFVEREQRWQVLAGAVHRSVKLGTPMAFEIRLKGRLLNVTIDGERAVAAHVGEIDVGGLWGVETGAGCAGSWRDVQLKRR